MHATHAHAIPQIHTHSHTQNGLFSLNGFSHRHTHTHRLSHCRPFRSCLRGRGLVEGGSCVCVERVAHTTALSHVADTHIYTHTFPRTHTSVPLSRQGSLDPRFSPHGQSGAALFSLAPFSPLAFFSLGDSGGGGGGAGGLSLPAHNRVFFYLPSEGPAAAGNCACVCARARV